MKKHRVRNQIIYLVVKKDKEMIGEFGRGKKGIGKGKRRMRLRIGRKASWDVEGKEKMKMGFV